ncbi:hypothetical protein L0128_12870 [candidate division KSB1 bacterium]|nr:hypothetical protein [candidate division KSB1 bacterium]
MHSKFSINSIFVLSLGVWLLVRANLSVASFTRSQVLGDVSIIQRDAVSYWLFPGTLGMTPNQLLLDLGGTAELLNYSVRPFGFNRGLGGNVAVDKSGPYWLGVFWSEAVDPNPFKTLSNPALPSEQMVDLFYGSKEANNFWGFHLSQHVAATISDASSRSSTETRLLRTQFDFGLSGPDLDFAIGGQVLTSQVSWNKQWGALFNIRNRWFRQTRNDLTLIPYFDLNLAFEKKSKVPKMSGLAWTTWLGLGLDYTLRARDHFLLGLSVKVDYRSLEQSESKVQQKNTIIEMPFIFGGLESELFPWLKIRFGFQKVLRRTSQTNNLNQNSQTATKWNAPFAISAGLGFQIPHWQLDVSWDPDFLKRGPYLLSGNKGDFLNFVSLTYRW